MQKISTYLYPNRIQLLADLAGFNVEYTNVYQRIVKIYKGVDNVIEFDVKNADQKRIDLVTSPKITDLELNVMDASGNALLNSPFPLTVSTGITGIAKTVIPATALDNLQHQFLSYTVTALDVDSNRIPLYGDSRFGASGTIELVGNATPVANKPITVHKDFTAEIDLKGIPIWHSSAIPTKFYEAVPTSDINFEIDVKGFVGTVWIDAATSDTVSVESWRAAGRPFGSWIHSGTPFTGTIPYSPVVPVGDYTYFRVSYQTLMTNGSASVFHVTKTGGVYTVTIEKGGTGYSVGAILKIPGSTVGGVDGANDILITITGIEGGGSSYTISSITSITAQGTATSGDGTYSVTGINYSGTIDKVTVSPL